MTTRPVLACLPYAGGSARIYLPWQRRLATLADTVAVELPGRGSRLRDLPVDRLPVLLDDLMARLAPYSGRPLILFGHSLGGLLAFELARLMRSRHGWLPARLIVSGHRAPHLPMREARIHYLPDNQFIARLRALDGTPEEVLGDAGLMRVLLPALRADFSVSERYRYAEAEPLSCPVTVLGGTADSDLPVGDLYAWARHTTRRCRTVLFPGGHFFLHTAETAVLEEVSRELIATEHSRVRTRA
ncbi:thioesterase II family protein [Micromonospora craniellae]|uniref:Thioesterase n=1 Tax=Micromonospora craniellae TaxID=2294034 RepID=A0A372FYB7_9ACTN|nr:alpha/beta fold hydrolase [Micromonospora craniellae]RFS45614.1 thioesterase [Micromonospora craniellae]